ncbi:sperm microtubule inner protein 11-like [Amphiura filiformis]|uniref:sperm microtubule inner protein 11-like n=1 Tax=Amphiura filiformis TaxID=82378 RepID=UPI003B215B34
MSFFQLTELGYQDHIRSQTKQPNEDSGYKLDCKIPADSYVTFRPPTSQLPPINMNQHNRVIKPGVNEEHKGSYVKYTERLHKHTRTEKAPNDLYRNPLTTSQCYGWWDQKDNVTKREPWAHVPRHVIVNSEMTRFVKEMSQTNREFSLF